MLQNTSRFQTDVARYKEAINKINNVEIKNQAITLLTTLINEVKKLDNQHHEMFHGNQAPMGLGDTRTGIATVRKKLDTLFKDVL
jgi:hypothetical protein